MQLKIKYIDAICGAGKTEAAIKYIIDKIRTCDDKFVLMMPTIPLIDQTAARFRAYGCTDDELKVIHGEDGDEGAVAKKIHNFFDRPDARGVLIITHFAWRWVKGRKVKDWHLILDECPQIFQVSAIFSQSIKDRILSHLIISPSKVDRYSSVIIRKGSGSAIRELIQKGHADSAIGCLKKAAERLHLGDKTYVTTANYEAFVGGRSNSITFYHVAPTSMLEGFKSVIIMGANFTHSELYRLWGHWGVHFKKMDRFARQEPLRTAHSEHTGRALDIHYLCDEYSAAFKKNHVETLEKEYRRAVVEVFKDKKVIHTNNEGDDQYLLQGLANGKFVKPKAHGQNVYKDVNCVAIFAHFNLSRDQAVFLKSVFNLEWESLRDLRNFDIYYQFVCRTSLRELPLAGSTEPKKIVVMDKDMALWLQSLFPGSRVHRFPSDSIAALPVPLTGRPKKPNAKTGAERARTYREKKRTDGVQRKIEILKGQWFHKSRNGNTLRIEDVTTVTEKKKKWPVSSMGVIYSTEVKAEYVDGFSGLVGKLREAHKREIGHKNENRVFNVTAFMMEGDNPRGRKLSDVNYSNAILLDMDSDENCCPEKFATEVCGLEMVIHSTFSSTAERKRWHVVIPLSRPVSAKEYKAIASDLIRLLGPTGFPFDPSKKNASDFMYLPCQSADKEASFFRHFTGEERRFLDVDAWLLG